jgi:L-lactate dehydrogenase complex protein LldG
LVAGALVSSAREEILRRVRGALRDVPEQERPSDVPVAREYRRERSLPRAQLIEMLFSRLHSYNAEASIVAPANIGQAVTHACDAWKLRRLVVPAALPQAWRPGDVELVEDDFLDDRNLDALDGAVTGCAVAIAETGTLVLDGQGSSGRRAITLIPDHHICIVTDTQIVALVAEALSRVGAAAHAGMPITLVSGPSASSDIELERVEGVHGPHHLCVLITSDRARESRRTIQDLNHPRDEDLNATNKGEHR